MKVISNLHICTFIVSYIIFQSSVRAFNRDVDVFARYLWGRDAPPSSQPLPIQSTAKALDIQEGDTVTKVVSTEDVVVTIPPSSTAPTLTTVRLTITSTPAPPPTSSTDSSAGPSETSSVQSSQSSPASATPTDQSPTPTCSDGFFLCAAVFNGGCCRNGFQCAASSCIAPSSITQSRTCATGSILCPASLNYGCCPDGYQCGVTDCVTSNGPPTGTLPTSVPAETTATDGSVVAGSPVITKGTDQNISSKIAPTTPSPTSDSSSGGLSTPAIGGIAAGGAIFVIALVVMVYFTFRRLRQRGNNDPMFARWDRRRHTDSPIPMGAPTTNAFDPNNPAPHSPGARRQTMPESYVPKSPNAAPILPERSPLRQRQPSLPHVVSPTDGGFDFGFRLSREEYERNHGQQAVRGKSDYQLIPQQSAEDSDFDQEHGNPVEIGRSGGSTPPDGPHEIPGERPKAGRHVSWSTET